MPPCLDTLILIRSDLWKSFIIVLPPWNFFFWVFNPGWRRYNISIINFFFSLLYQWCCHLCSSFQIISKKPAWDSRSADCLPPQPEGAVEASQTHNKLCVCDVKPPSSRVFVHAKKRKKLVTNVIYGMQLASENNKKSVQQRCGSIGNQYSTRMMIPTCNRPYRFWTSSRLLFCSVWVVFLSGRYEDAWREPYVWAPGQPVDVIVKVSGKKKIQGLIFIFYIFVFVCFFPQSSQFLMRDQVNIVKALKSNSALCVTSRPPSLILHERLQRREWLE